MVQFICPNCGSKYFIASKTGPKNVFNITDGRTIQFVQLRSEVVEGVSIETQRIYCGACSWQGGLDEVVASHTE